MEEIDIREIEGFKIGHYTDSEAGTGCTVIICKEGGIAGVDIRGGAPATRETALLNPENMVERIHSIVLSGGSAYGLDASSGVMKYLEERGIGFTIGTNTVPIVCAASLFDLEVGNGAIRPDKDMGYKACINSEKNILEEGNVGAGTGATIGKILGKDYAMKSGIGIYATKIGELKIGAIIALNALGDIIDSDGRIIAGLLDEDRKSFKNSKEILISNIDKERIEKNKIGNTTLGCIITNAKLKKVEANRIARIAHNGYAKSISPVHTSLDGDTIFTISYGDIDIDKDILASISVDIIARAVRRAAKKAKSAYGFKGFA
ncbi:MAG: P1 family peptidase [Andreesenia angusta]|nr:P1 family peptidase [Andreesenia angusta]